jgi:hypothetical protein
MGLDVVQGLGRDGMARTDHAGLQGRTTLKQANRHLIADQMALLEVEKGRGTGQGGHLKIGGTTTDQGREPQFPGLGELPAQGGAKAGLSRPVAGEWGQDPPR